MNDEPQAQLPGDIDAPIFTPVPLQRVRHDGWTPQRQLAFIKALCVTGSVEAAARMVRISRKSAYALRLRPGAEEFAWAWDTAIGSGRARMYEYMFDRALNGVTTITMRMGGALELSHGPDQRLVAAQLTSPLPGQNRLGRGKARPGQSPRVT